MSMYTPVVIGSAGELRAGVESMLSLDSGAVAERLDQLTATTESRGRSVTFGAEVEFMMPHDPTENYGGYLEKDELYAEIINEIVGTDIETDKYNKMWTKGSIVLPGDNPGPVMLNYNMSANRDQRNSGIIEVRTAPADAVEAAERYWKTIDAIGTVAARHGRMGMILGTHVNTAIYDAAGKFVDFSSEEGGRIIAAAQHNLEALNPLQIDSGLEEGINVLEAFPGSKDGSTTIHDLRLELRHAAVGVADPRVDFLAVLDGVNQHLDDAVSGVAINALRACRMPWVTDRGDWYALREVIEGITVWDEQARRLVMPSHIIRGARADDSDLYEMSYLLSASPSDDAIRDNGRTIREFLSDVRLDDNRHLYLRKGTSVQPRIAQLLSKAEIRFGSRVFRTLPAIAYESPGLHAQHRRNIGRSNIMRRVLGAAAQTLTPATTSIAMRDELVSSSMAVLQDEVVEEQLA